MTKLFLLKISTLSRMDVKKVGVQMKNKFKLIRYVFWDCLKYPPLWIAFIALIIAYTK